VAFYSTQFHLQTIEPVLFTSSCFYSSLFSNLFILYSLIEDFELN